jgi:hypothetical protein
MLEALVKQHEQSLKGAPKQRSRQVFFVRATLPKAPFR